MSSARSCLRWACPRAATGARGGAQPGGETEEHAAARKAVAGAFEASGGTYGHGRITARADAGSEPGGRVGERAAYGITGGEAWSRGWRGEDGATAPMGAGSPNVINLSWWHSHRQGA